MAATFRQWVQRYGGDYSTDAERRTAYADYLRASREIAAALSYREADRNSE